MRLSHLAITTLCLAPQALVYADESFATQCVEEYNQGHTEKALYYCHGAASNAQAQYILGKIYSMEGLASPEMKKAYEYFSASAHQNNPDAQFMLALCYQNGLGVAKNTKTATYWYDQALAHGYTAPPLNPKWDRGEEKIMVSNWPGAEEFQQAMELKQNQPSNADGRLIALSNAAEKGHIEAEYQLGMLYAAGDGVPQDDGKALFWLQKAANKNHQGAQSYLAWMSSLGLGKPQNQAEAVQWFLQAKQSSPKAQEALEDDLDKLFSGLNEDRNHLVNRTPESEYQQGKELIESRMCDQDYKDGLTLLEKAAEEHYPPAQLYLARLYHEGGLVEKDLGKASKWYHEAAQNGEPEAQYTLGWMYFYGDGVPQSNEQAFHWFAKANEHEAKARQAMQFLESQEPVVELGTQKVSTPLKVKLQRAGSYLRSLLPSRKSSSS